MKVDGRCHCGKISYRAELDPDRVGVCHCTDCQTISGAPFRTFAPVDAAGFEFTGDRPKIYVKTAESGTKRAQAFCPDCGTAIYASDAVEEPAIYNLRIGAIRQRDQLTPSKQVWCRSAQGWADHLPIEPKIETQ